MVRIHGGGFAMGSGSWAWHDGSNLARRGDVVVVTLNHRLGVLGYLHLGDILGGDFMDSGNAGMLDLVAALRWVRDNIAAFGGDPDNVTIFGESGGGYKVSTLLAMPDAQGLFHRAIVQSGPSLQVQTPEAAAVIRDAILEELGLSHEHAADLQTVPVDRLLAAQLALARAGTVGGAMGFSPVLQPGVLPAHPGDAIAAGASAGIPLLIGTVRHEATMFLAMESIFGGALPTLDDAALEARAKALLGDRAEDTLDVYRRAQAGASPLELYAIIQSDQMMRIPSIRLAEQKLIGGRAAVFMYLLAWQSPALDGFVRATHGLCVPLTMDNVDSAPMAGDYPISRQVAARMSEAWLSFARHGDPNHGGLPQWDPYSVKARATMVFDEICTAVDDPFGDERRAWGI
jgi:para-nitrobenzyl esterase